jgi:hypothetical protein
MPSFFSIAVAAAALIPFAVAVPQTVPRQTYNFDPAAYAASLVIKKDVVIIGGGSTGTYSAIRLKDQGKSVIVIEKKDRMGGHTETYIDPVTKSPIDIGVKLLHDAPLVRNYFARFGLNLVPFSIDGQGGRTQAVDLRTGKQITGVVDNATALGEAFGRYAGVISQWPELDRGYFLPEPVPADLYQPFGQFVTKYGLDAAVWQLFFIGANLGDILKLPTVQVIRIYGLSLLTTSFITTEHGNNSELYEKAQAELLAAKSVLLSSTVVATLRGDAKTGVKILVQTPQGLKLILAKKLLITIPPKNELLTPFDSNAEEKGLFAKFLNVGYFTAIVKNAGLAPDLTINNHGQGTPYGLPVLPAMININPTVNPNLTLLYYGTQIGQTLSDDVVKNDIIAGLKRYQVQNPNDAKRTEPEFVVFSNHSPYNLFVNSEDTKNGFYKKLYALQGKRNTWWTGATWKAQDSSSSWQYTEDSVLPGLIASL